MASYHEGSTYERTETAVSPALASAQERLLELRQSFRQSRALLSGDPAPPTPKSKQILNALAGTDAEQHRSRRRKARSAVGRIEQLPLHLGWDSAGVTAVLQQAQKHDEDDVGQALHRHDTRPSTVTPHTSRLAPPLEPPPYLKVYPSVAQGMVREGHTAAGRIWLLLRCWDKNGRGWFTEAEAQRFFTSKNISAEPRNQNIEHGIQNTRSSIPHPTYLFGQRQWRNLVKKGTGIFWRRENGRLWLNSVSKTAAALGIWQLTGRPVQIPITALTGKISTVRAHLYATFHSSRAVTCSGKQPQQPQPIARETLTAQFNISPRTQRSYERKARVKSHKNYAIGKKESAENAKEAAWQHGLATFSLTDHLGKNGRSRATYLAWQLPNHYFGPHQPACRGQQKRINRELADLFMKGMTGNDNESVDGNNNLTAEARRTQSKRAAPLASLASASTVFNTSLRLKNIPKRFCANGAAAAKVYNHSQANRDVYWRSTSEGIWHVLEKTKEIDF